MSNKKILFVLPPEWIPSNPYLSLAVLKGELEKAGYEADTVDLNIRFFNRILTRDCVLEMMQRAEKDLYSLREIFPDTEVASERFAFMDASEKTKLIRLMKLEELYSEGFEKAEKTANEIEKAVSVMKDNESFFDPEKLFRAKGIIKNALRYVSSPFAPSEICYDNYYPNPVMGLDYEGIKAQSLDEKDNMFVSFFRDEIEKAELWKYDAVGISVVDLSQLVPAMTLGRIIKEKYPRIHICMGGNYITKTFNNLDSQPDFFSLFADTLLTGDGEISCVEWAQFINGEKEIGSVHSLTFCEDGKVRHNEKAPLLDMDALAIPDFDDYDFSLYLTPCKETIIPIQLSKGCYWGKCTFCDFFYGQQSFDIKSVDRAIAEIKNAVEKYGISKFTFVDEAVPPEYYNELSLAIIREGLRINFYSFVRLENGFTLEVLSNMKKAGGCMFMWGYEAQSHRIMKLINKGIDLDNRLNILKNSADAGIWNHCTFLLGYPTETMEEIESTIDIIKNRKDVVNSCTPSNFSLKEKSMIIKNLHAFGIDGAKKNGDFHISYSDVVTGGITMKERKEIRHSFQNDFLNETARHLWTLTFYDIDHLFLYTARYPVGFIMNYRLSFDKNI